MAIVNFVPLIEQVAEIHIDACKFLQNSFQSCTSLLNDDLKWLEEI